MAHNDSHFRPQALPHNVRLLRRAHEPDHSARFILCGKLSDVCAALAQLEDLEQRNACV